MQQGKEEMVRWRYVQDADDCLWGRHSSMAIGFHRTISVLLSFMCCHDCCKRD